MKYPIDFMYNVNRYVVEFEKILLSKLLNYNKKAYLQEDTVNWSLQDDVILDKAKRLSPPW